MPEMSVDRPEAEKRLFWSINKPKHKHKNKNQSSMKLPSTSKTPMNSLKTKNLNRKNKVDLKSLFL